MWKMILLKIKVKLTTLYEITGSQICYFVFMILAKATQVTNNAGENSDNVTDADF